jgi:hypothetical protein
MDFQSEVFGDFEPSVLVIDASDGKALNPRNSARRKRRDPPDHPKLGPLRKKFRLGMEMELEGEREIGVFGIALAEIAYF